MTLFARSFPHVTVRPQQLSTQGAVTTAHYGWLKSDGGANAAIEMGSLARYLRGELSDFPNPHAYLLADDQEKHRWRDDFTKNGPAPFIGICWRSGKMTGGRALQYAPRQAWAKFLNTVSGTIVCVQYDATADEVKELEDLSGRKIVMPESIDQKQELDRACALLCALDAVISAPTAVSWLAAAAGVATYKILYDRSWTSFGLDHEALAPSAYCMRPKSLGDWRGVFDTTRAFIQARFANP